jgi:hypothetical protein
MNLWYDHSHFRDENWSWVLLLVICPKESKTAYNMATGIPMFIVALFTITKLWNQPQYPTTEECTKKI